MNPTKQIPDYSQLLQRPEWKYKRQRVLQRDRYACKNCGSKQNLHVHHKQYHKYKATGRHKDPWNYNDRILITLCEHCHTTGHKMYHVPVFTI